jgi:Flp pilus assembly secretin CpaC
LADIPLLGDLFRYDSSRVVRTELLIVLTPHVIHNGQEMEQIKRVESQRMSWCLSDVVDLNGASGLRSRTDQLGGAEAETVYPAATPEELNRVAPQSREMLPTPATNGPADQAPVLAPPTPPSPIR